MILALLVAGVVSGVVVDETTGGGVRKAEVILLAGREGQSAMTDAEGRFKFETVAPGRYQIQVHKAGYEFREGRGQGSKGWVEVGQGSSETGLRYVLRPLGLITGRVVDPDGDPVIGARIMLVRQVRRNSRTSWTMAQGGGVAATTDDRGEFRLHQVASGKYVVGCTGGGAPRFLASRTNRSGTVPVFFPDAPDPETAQLLEIKAGTRMEGITLKTRISPLYMISGRVTGLAGEQGLGVHVNVEQAAWANMMGAGRATSVMKDAGEFVVGPLPPGSYTLFAQQMRMGPAESGGGRRSQDQLAGVAMVALTDRDVDGVSIQLGPGVSIEGSVVLEGEKEAAVKSLFVMVQSREENGYAQGSEVKADGTFQFRVARPGKYLFRPFAQLGDRYLASIRAGGEEVLGREIDLTYGSPGPVRLLYKKDGGRVEGTVKTTEPGGFGRMSAAVLWPVDERFRPFPYLSKADLTPQGTFAFKNVAPGEYLVFASTINDQRIWMEASELPKEIEEQAVRVKVMAGSSSTVEIPLVQWPEE